MRVSRYLPILALLALPLFAADHTKANVYPRATKLAAILEDAQSNANITAPSWKSIANEAHHLSNMIMSDTGSNHGDAHHLASEARKHIRLMRTAAGNGEAAGARSHAKEALTYVNQLVEWSAPKM